MVRVYEDTYSRSTSQLTFNARIYYRVKKKSATVPHTDTRIKFT
jgi:hypothetical protein